MIQLYKKILLFCLFIGLNSIAHAQIEVARLQSKNFSATGFGAFLNFGFTVNPSDVISTEAGLYVFIHDDNHVAETPLLIGYRHLLTADDHGLYVEPLVGYTFSFTDIHKTDANGNDIYDANLNPIDIKMQGATAGLGFGYLFRQSGGSIPIQFNIGLRYEHVFVSGYSSPNIFSLRISHAFAFGRRD